MTAADPVLMTAEELVSHYARGSLSPVEAVEAVNERIAAFNPRLNAFATMNPDALAEARESDARWRAGRPRGLLDGVPVTVKDLINVTGLPTRRGSVVTDAAPATEDSPLVLGLKAEGAVIIGKTTTSEFGWKTPGDCPLHGITRNPWNPAFSTGGSSSGAGAAAAACFGPLHIGTDAGGSVRIPAAWCGVFGLKPTYGRVPQWPHGTFSALAAAGPITRSVRDAALLLSAIARADLRDPYCLPDDPRDWRAGIEDGVAEMRVAVLRRPGFDAPADAAATAAVEEAARLLTEAGAEVEEADPGLPDPRDIFGRFWATAISRMVSLIPEDKRHLLDAGLLEVASSSAQISGLEVLEAEALRVAGAHAMARLHRQYDVVLCPTVPNPPPLADAATIDPLRTLWTEWACWTFAFNLTRQPAMAVPMGFDESGLPRSVQVAAAQYRDDLVLRAARTLEVAQPPEVVDLAAALG